MQASPGPAVLTLIAYSLEFGKTLGAGLAVAFVVGQLTALLVGVMGVAVMMAKMPEAFGVLRFAGGCLLLYVGLSSLLQKSKQTLQPELANKWLMSLEPKDRNIVPRHFSQHGYEEASHKDIRHQSTVATESHCYAVANTWFIAASSPIAIVFYTAVFPDFVDVAGLDSTSLVFLGSCVFGISLVASVFYILTTCFTRTMLTSSAIGMKISSLANIVLILAGVWVIDSAIG